MNTGITITAAATAAPELTVVERAAVLRACREKRMALREAIETLKSRATAGDKTADSAVITLQAELSILEAGVQVLWRQSGATGPPPE